MMSFIMRLTSVWKVNFCARSRNSRSCATLSPSAEMASSSRATASASATILLFLINTNRIVFIIMAIAIVSEHNIYL